MALTFKASQNKRNSFDLANQVDTWKQKEFFRLSFAVLFLYVINSRNEKISFIHPLSLKT